MMRRHWENGHTHGGLDFAAVVESEGTGMVHANDGGHPAGQRPIDFWVDERLLVAVQWPRGGVALLLALFEVLSLSEMRTAPCSLCRSVAHENFSHQKVAVGLKLAAFRVFSVCRRFESCRALKMASLEDAAPLADEAVSLWVSLMAKTGRWCRASYADLSVAHVQERQEERKPQC